VIGHQLHGLIRRFQRCKLFEVGLVSFER
jgi:hypothetical protein